MIEYFKNLKKFNTIEVTLQIGCSLQCRYCPQKLLISNYCRQDRVRRMSFEAFAKYIDNVRTGGGIVFSGMSEPFLNADCAKMIKYAYEKGYKISLFTTLMGMKEEDLELIKDVAFDYVTLHIPDAEGNAKFVLDDAYFKMLEKFTQSVKVNNYSCHGQVHPLVMDYVDKQLLGTSMMNRAGNLDYEELETYAPKGKVVCQIGTIESPGCWAPEVLPDGTVLLCCMDYGMRHVLGNLNENSANEILNGREACRVMKGMEDDGIDILCRSCGSAVEVGKLGVSRLCEKLKSDVESPVLNKIRHAKNICIYGLGKYFRDTYFSLKYNEAIQANLFSDGNIGETDYVTEGEIIVPERMSDYEDLLVITWVKNPWGINKRLEELGIKNYMNVVDVLNEARE